MNRPEQQQIDHWLKSSQYQIDRAWRLNSEGFHKKNNVPLQSVYTNVALDHASLARAKFLNGDPIEEVRAEFAKASQCILKSFKMAYDEFDPDFIGDMRPPENPHYTGNKGSGVTARWQSPVYGQVSWADVSETDAIEGINYALLSGDFDLSCEMASWFQDRPDGYKMDWEVNRYAHILANIVKGSKEEALRLLHDQMKEYEKKPAKKGYRYNYFTMSLAAEGIMKGCEKEFNEGLLAMVQFYDSYAQGEVKNTTSEFIYDHAAALANLGIKSGLRVTIEYGTLLEKLLITS